jgi:hypothetical protein
LTAWFRSIATTEIEPVEGIDAAARDYLVKAGKGKPNFEWVPRGVIAFGSPERYVTHRAKIAEVPRSSGEMSARVCA